MSEQIYFFLANCRIKIGTTSVDVAVRKRQVELGIREPLTLLGAMFGGTPLERAIHQYLRAHNLGGEWFRDCPSVRLCIENLLSDGPAAIGFGGEVIKLNSRAQQREEELRRPRDPHRAFAVMAVVIWPHTAAAELAAFAGVNEVTALHWLDGKEPVPRLVRYAFTFVISHFCLRNESDPPISFLDGDPEWTVPARDRR